MRQFDQFYDEINADADAIYYSHAVVGKYFRIKITTCGKFAAYCNFATFVI